MISSGARTGSRRECSWMRWGRHRGDQIVGERVVEERIVDKCAVLRITKDGRAPGWWLDGFVVFGFPPLSSFCVSICRHRFWRFGEGRREALRVRACERRSYLCPRELIGLWAPGHGLDLSLCWRLLALLSPIGTPAFRWEHAVIFSSFAGRSLIEQELVRGRRPTHFPCLRRVALAVSTGR